VSQPTTVPWTDPLTLPGGSTETIASSVTYTPVITTSLVHPIDPDPLTPDPNHVGVLNTPNPGALEPLQTMTLMIHWTIASPTQQFSGDFSSQYVNFPGLGYSLFLGGPLYSLLSQGFPNAASIRVNDEPEFYPVGSTPTNRLFVQPFNGTIDGVPWAMQFSPVLFSASSGSFYQLQAVPEPSTIVLAALGMLVCAVYRRRTWYSRLKAWIP
jgi:hypothetical protein